MEEGKSHLYSVFFATCCLFAQNENAYVLYKQTCLKQAEDAAHRNAIDALLTSNCMQSRKASGNAESTIMVRVLPRTFNKYSQKKCWILAQLLEASLMMHTTGIHIHTEQTRQVSQHVLVAGRSQSNSLGRLIVGVPAVGAIGAQARLHACG